MKKYFAPAAIYILFSFHLISAAKAGWQVIPTNSSAYLTSVFFINSMTGYIGGINGFLSKTTDGGVSWTVQDPLFASSFVRDLYFINANTGYLCGDNGFIRKTTNGGNNWIPLTTNTIGGIYGIDAADELNVYASVTDGTILRSTNGGASFTGVSVSANQLLTVDFSSRDTGYVSGQGGVVYKTTDAGLTWNFLNAFTLNNFWDICALNNNELYLAAYYGTLRKSANGGGTFKSAFGNNYLFEDIQMINKMIGYTCGLDGILNKTTDGGNTWSAQISNTTESLNEIFFLDANTGYAAGTNGLLLKTTDGGDNFNVAVISPNNREVLTAGSAIPVKWSAAFSGNVKIEYSLNSGASWNVIQNSVPAELFEYEWIVPTGNSNQCKVKITSVDNPAISDVSDGIFNILNSSLFYNVPELVYYKFNNGINTTPNYAVPGEVYGNARISGMTLQNGGLADSSLTGGGESGATHYVSTDWATYLPGSGWTIGFWISNISLGADPNNAVYLFSDITANNIRCYYGGALGLTAADTAIMFRCTGMENVRIPVVRGRNYYIHIVYEASPSVIKVYVNGMLTQNIPHTPFSIIGNGPFIIGALATFHSSLSQNMRLDEFRVYDRPLAQQEITATWNVTFPSIITGVQNQINSVPTEFVLYDNFPNPFNPVTAIRYSISESKYVSLMVFDILGKKIADLVNQKQNPGKYEIKFDGSNLSSGIYFYELRSGNYVSRKKMALIK